MAEEDTEITLGMGKLLGLFFMLALTCGIFFAVGYSLGKTAEREQALKNQPAQTLPADPDLASSKPSGTPGSEGKGLPATDNSAEGKQTAPDLTFYRAVKQTPGDETKPAEELKSTGTTTNAANSNTAATKPREMPAATPAPAKPSGLATTEASPTASASPPQASPSGTFLVQIAAVTHEEDAAALAGALRKKSYAAAVVNSPNGKDKLFHVVLGPYASLQDAEAMKVKLQGEGYSPIVKR
jgi:DedD protein